MKPRIFIGSSVEGLKIAYAIQQNLRHNAETTVWDQGVFDLTATSIESLIEVLDNSDFGIFVFSPDDVVKIRGIISQTVRDNVLFELGLFIGRLGRKRTFIVMPEGIDIKLPTDLLGITPGKYEVGRSDNSDQAATGATSHQIRLSIEKLGSRNIERSEPVTGSDSNINIEKSEEFIWIDLYLENKYEESLKELDKLIKKEKDIDKKLNLVLWVAQINWVINPDKGDKLFRKSIKDNIINPKPYLKYIDILIQNDTFDKVLKLIEEGISNTPNAKDDFISKHVDYLIRIGKEDLANDLLVESIEENKTVNLYLKHTEINNNDKESHKIIHEAYSHYPMNEQVILKYSDIADKLKLYKMSLFLHDKLLKINSKNSTYWTTQGNLYLNLGLNGKAMISYEKANKLVEGEQAWVLGNIGNLFNNVDLYSNAINYLEMALEKNPKSEYAHNRLSSAIKKKDEESKKVTDFLKEGRIEIQNINFDAKDDTTVSRN